MKVRFDSLFLISFPAHDLDGDEPRFGQTPSSVCSHFGREIAVNQLYRTVWRLFASFDHRTRIRIWQCPNLWPRNEPGLTAGQPHQARLTMEAGSPGATWGLPG